MVSRTVQRGGRSVTALLLAFSMALVAVLPFAGSTSAQEADSAIAQLGLQPILVRAMDEAYAVVVSPPVAEGWTQVTLQNETQAPATVNFVKLNEGQTAGDISAAVYGAFRGDGGTLPDWWGSSEFAGGAWAAAGATVNTAIYLTPGRWVVFSSNPFSPQPVQTFAVATPDELVEIYGLEPEATPVGAEPRVEGLPHDAEISIADGGFTGTEAPVAGPQVWQVTNDSFETSELIIAYVSYDIPLEEAQAWVPTVAAGNIGSGVVQNATGLISPGASAYLELNLASGTYVVFSASPSSAGGLQSETGLVQVIQVP